MIRYGFCMICDKEIAPKCQSCDVRRPTDQFSEVQVTWSNGAKMRIAICSDCSVKNSHTTAYGKNKITAAHQKHWDETGGTYDKAVFIV